MSNVYYFSSESFRAVCHARANDFEQNDLDHILIHIDGKDSYLCGMNLHRMICVPFTSCSNVRRDFIFKPTQDFLKVLRLRKACNVYFSADDENIVVLDRSGSDLCKKYICYSVSLGTFDSYPNIKDILSRADSCQSEKIDGIALSGDDLAMLCKAYPKCNFSFRFSGSYGMIRVTAKKGFTTYSDRIVFMPIKEN